MYLFFTNTWAITPYNHNTSLDKLFLQTKFEEKVFSIAPPQPGEIIADNTMEMCLRETKEDTSRNTRAKAHGHQTSSVLLMSSQNNPLDDARITFHL